MIVHAPNVWNWDGYLSKSGANLKLDTDLLTDRWLSDSSNTFLGADVAGGAFGALEHTTGSEGWQNTFIGKNVGASITTGYNNTAVGFAAAPAITTAIGVVGMGYQALYSNTADYSVGIGYQALYTNSSGVRNTAVGYKAGYTNNAGYGVFVGYRAGELSTGSENVFIGANAGQSATTGYFLMYMGYRAGFSTTDGYNNVAIGRKALEANVSGNGNVAIGSSAGVLSTGSGCVYIGASAGAQNTASNKLYIAITNTETPLIGGDFSAGYVVINGGLRVAGDVAGAASHNSFTGVTDTPTANPGWATSSTVNMTAPNGYIKAYVGTQAVVIPYWNT